MLHLIRQIPCLSLLQVFQSWQEINRVSTLQQMSLSLKKDGSALVQNADADNKMQFTILSQTHLIKTVKFGI